MSQPYNRVNWINETTRLNADNLNKMDKGIEDASKDIISLEQTVTTGFENVNTELANKLSSDLKGVASGIAPLDEKGKVPEQHLPEISSSNIPSMRMDSFMAIAETEGQTEFAIPLEDFDIENHIIMVQSGRTILLQNQDFAISDNNIVLTEGVPLGRTIGIYITRILNGELPYETAPVDGRVIAENSLPVDRIVDGISKTETETKITTAKSEIENKITEKETEILTQTDTKIAEAVEGATKTYLTFAEIGLTEPTTIEEIYNALEADEALSVSLGENSVADMPLANGHLLCTKSNGMMYCEYRAPWNNDNNNSLWLGTYKETVGFSGWSNLASGSGSSAYISLEQINLTENDITSDNFTANMSKIVESSVGDNESAASFTISLTAQSQSAVDNLFRQSIFKKITEDIGITVTDDSIGTIWFNTSSHQFRPFKIDVNIELPGDIQFLLSCFMNKNSDGDLCSKFTVSFDSRYMYGAHNVTYGASELQTGITTLAPGHIYFQYE